tara:strand:+ start:4524 stop:6281 length:1758 start_codon:yes stop_codon:yes gene_type:complete
MSSIVERLTEGMVNRDMKKEGHALLKKWEKTGLLEGLQDERKRQSMARLLENQAKELLREVSTMSGGDVEGFAAVAFPIVRRVFAGLIANDLVSVQPMSLPSGLIFFLDFTVSNTIGEGTSTNGRLSYEKNESIYGQGVVGQEITGGVSMTLDDAEDGPWNLNNGYSSTTASLSNVTLDFHTSGTYGTGDEGLDKILRWDLDLTSGSTRVTVLKCPVGRLTSSNGNVLDGSPGNLQAITLYDTNLGTFSKGHQVRRLTQFSGSAQSHILLVVASTGSEGSTTQHDITNYVTGNTLEVTFPIIDKLQSATAVGSVIGATDWALENEGNIPEIDIQVGSIAVTAQTKKLKAKWTPELGQDLNAYHNLDAEVELTQILSEQIALEIDREILADLVNGAKAGKYYWSRSPGMFLNRTSGEEVGAASAAPDFTGTVSEWYETLVETINDVSAQIHRKTLRGGANFIVCSPEVAAILEFTAGFRANVTVDGETGTVGAVKTGNLSKKWDVYVDPYFLRSVILVGRKGGSFLESGYVYAPYVPLQTTPTIFGPEDFVPRKGVMTRYAKKMVRPDMYGLVIVRGMLGESGATS